MSVAGVQRVTDHQALGQRGHGVHHLVVACARRQDPRIEIAGLAVVGERSVRNPAMVIVQVGVVGMMAADLHP